MRDKFLRSRSSKNLLSRSGKRRNKKIKPFKQSSFRSTIRSEDDILPPSANDWKSMVQEYLSHSSTNENNDDDDDSQQKKDQEILHFLCRYHPPLSIIKSVSTTIPTSLTHIDNQGNTPLHIASQWGASHVVIKYLVKQIPSFATLPNRQGMTPLHLVCQCYPLNYRPDEYDDPETPEEERRLMSENMYRAVRTLVKSYIADNNDDDCGSSGMMSMVNQEDNSGRTALEYAVESESDMRVIKYMQTSSTSDWRERRRVEEGKKHEDVVRELTMVDDVERIFNFDFDDDDESLDDNEAWENIDTEAIEVLLSSGDKSRKENIPKVLIENCAVMARCA